MVCFSPQGLGVGLQNFSGLGSRVLGSRFIFGFSGLGRLGFEKKGRVQTCMLKRHGCSRLPTQLLGL